MPPSGITTTLAAGSTTTGSGVSVRLDSGILVSALLGFWKGRSAADPDATPSLPIKTAPVSAEEGDRLVAANDIPPGAIREDAILAM